MLSCIGFGKPINVVTSSLIENPTNFFRVCSRNASKSFCLQTSKYKIIFKQILFFVYRTFGTHGNSFIIKVDAGSILDASLANEVVDSAELKDGVGVDGVIIVPSSSVDVLLPLTDPSSLATSESKADCLVKLYEKKEGDDDED